MDGLLLDTEGAYTIAQQQVLDRFGLTFTWEHKARARRCMGETRAKGVAEGQGAVRRAWP